MLRPVLPVLDTQQNTLKYLILLISFCQLFPSEILQNLNRNQNLKIAHGIQK